MSEHFDITFPEEKKSIKKESNQKMSKIIKNNLFHKFYELFNFLLFGFIFILLPVVLLDDSYIEIKFNSNEDIQKLNSTLKRGLISDDTNHTNETLLDLIIKAINSELDENKKTLN